MRAGILKAGIRDSGFGIGNSRQLAAMRSAESPIPNRQSRQQGFSLLEVIAALLLLAIAFAALMKVAGGAIQLSRNAAAHDEVALRARSLLDSAFVTEPLVPGTSRGTFDKRYRWALDVTPWPVPGASPDSTMQMYRLDLAVRWGSAAHPQVAHFVTLRLGWPQARTGGGP